MHTPGISVWSSAVPENDATELYSIFCVIKLEAFFIRGLGHKPEISLTVSLCIQTESSDFPGFSTQMAHCFGWTQVAPSATKLLWFVWFCFFLLPPAHSTTALFQYLTLDLVFHGMNLASWPVKMDCLN